MSLSSTLVLSGTALVSIGSCLVAWFLAHAGINLVVKIKNSSPAQRVIARLQRLGSTDTDEEKIELADRLLIRFVQNKTSFGLYIVGGVILSGALSLVSLDLCYFTSVITLIFLIIWLQNRKNMAKKISTESFLFVQNLRLRVLHREDLFRALSDMVSGDLTSIGKPLDLLLHTNYQSNMPSLMRHLAETMDLPLFNDLANQVDLATSGRISLNEALELVEDRAIREMNLELNQSNRDALSKLTIFSIVAILLPAIIGFGVPLVTILSAMK